MLNSRKRRVVEKFLQGAVLVTLVILTISMMFNINSIQGNARVINYTGLIRGTTQRVVKLEIVNQGDDTLIQYLDDIFDGLMNGGGKYDLTVLPDQTYQHKLKSLYRSWNDIKEMINECRVHMDENRLIELSENYFVQADDTVGAAENYSQRCATRIRSIENLLIGVIIIMISILIKETVSLFMLLRKNHELNKKAYLDLATGLPNRSSIEEMMKDYRHYNGDYAVVIFDLNDLKKTNDSLGHISGDKLIEGFAHIIRQVIPKEHFIGRYGGDEFIAIMHDVDLFQLQNMIAGIKKEIKRHNEKDPSIHIDFAYGYAFSKECPGLDIQHVLNKADKDMYLTKTRMKINRKDD